MSAYVTPEIASKFAQEFTSLGDQQELILEAASRFFDNQTEVSDGFFNAVSGESDKVFIGDGTAYLKLPPYTYLGADPIVILDNDDDEVEIPLYLEQDGFLVIRGQGIRRRNPVTDSFKGWPVNAEITVSASWGFAAVPADVRMAVIQIALHWWRMGDPAFTVVSGTATAVGTDSIPPQSKVVIEKYRRKYSQVASFA